MTIEVLKSLMDNGVAIAILAFFLWFFLKPLFNAHIQSYRDLSQTMKEVSESMKEMLDKFPDHQRIEKKMDENREDLKKHIDSKFPR